MTDDLEELRTLGEIAMEDVRQVTKDTDNMIETLERKFDVIETWKNNAEILNLKLDRVRDMSKFDELPNYKDAYLKILVGLRESALQNLAEIHESSPATGISKILMSSHSDDYYVPK